MKKLHFFSALLFFILCANGLLAQEKSNIDQSDLEIEKLTRQKDYLRTRIYEIVRENKILEDKIKIFADKANAYDEVVAKDQKIISEVKVAYDQLEHDMKALQEENNSLLTSLQDKENFIQNTQENVEKEMLSAKERFSVELEQKNQNLEVVQNELKESQESLIKIQAQYNLAQEALVSVRKEKEEVDENSNLHMSTVVENLKDKLQQTENKLQHSEDEFQKAGNKFSELEKQNAALITNENGKKKVPAQLSIDKELLSVELAAETDKYKAPEKKFNQLLEEKNHLTEDLDALKARNHDLEEKNAGLMTENKNRDALMSELKKNKESLTQELASFSERYKTLEEKFNQISQSAVKNDQLIAKEVEKARKPLEELNANLEKRVAELTSIVEKEGQNISELVEKRRDAEIASRALTNENKKISEKLVSLEGQLKSTQESSDAKMVEIKTPLDGKILFLEEKLKKMDADEAAISQLSKDKDQLQAELKILRDENKKLNSDLAAVNDLLHETDGFVARKVEEAVNEKDAQIKQLKEKLGMTEEEGKISNDTLTQIQK